MITPLYNTLMGSYLEHPFTNNNINSIDKDKMPDDYQDWVYILYNKLNNQCKIGRSTNLNNRIRSLRSASGIEYNLLLAINLETGWDYNSEAIEEFLHNHYKDRRNIGEWFTLSLRDLIALRTLFYYIDGIGIEDNFTESVKDLTQSVKKTAQ